jgi:hypothetical protein
MSKLNGYIVFKATSEMAKQMPNVFKEGATYVAQEASVVSLDNKTTYQVSNVSSKMDNSDTESNVESKEIESNKLLTPKHPKNTKYTKRNPIKPNIIINYVKDNEGCNMTDIEVEVGAPQATIRRILNTARKAGTIRTEGQRRGLRYFDNKKVDNSQETLLEVNDLVGSTEVN